MWELYTFWAFVPLMLTSHEIRNTENSLDVPFLSFLIIASGGISCVAAGLLSQRFGTKQVATAALLISCICCLISPLILFKSPLWIFILFLFIWGIAVIADSPLFSTLIANNAPAQVKGSSLTIVNCIGFSITIVSIQTITFLSNKVNPQYLYLFLAIGPALGLIALLNGTLSVKTKHDFK